MAKNRKRFYVARYINGKREVLSLKFKPSPAVYEYLGISIVEGPYRTLDDASRALGCESMYAAQVLAVAESRWLKLGLPLESMHNLVIGKA